MIKFNGNEYKFKGIKSVKFNGEEYGKSPVHIYVGAYKGIYKLNGNTWEQVHSSSYGMYQRLAFNGTTYMAVSQNNQYGYYSTNGTTWNYNNKQNYSTGLAYGNGYWVQTGDGKNLSFYSANGTTWTKMPDFPSDTFSWKVAFGNGRFIAVGNQTSSWYYCTDPTQGWTGGTGSLNYNMIDICYSSQGFLATGRNGSVYHSVDGISFTAVNKPGGYSYNISGCAGGLGKYVVIVNNNPTYYLYYTTDNGTTWKKCTIPSESTAINTVSFCGDRFIVGCLYGVSYQSTDGITFTALTTLPDTSSALYGACAGTF